LIARIVFVVCLVNLAGCQFGPPEHCDIGSTLAPIDIPSPSFEKVDLAPGTNRLRAQKIFDLWRESCPQSKVLDVARTRYNNFSCLIPGLTNSRIVIASHYDKIGGGRGVADNWSGVLIVHQLLKYFMANRPEFSLEFVAFAQEEEDMMGSRDYLDSVDTGQIVAMINVDTIGLGPLIIDTRSSLDLGCLAQETADILGLRYLRSGYLTAGDWKPFKDQDIPVLNLHSVDRRTIRRIHSRRDRAGNADMSYLSEAYRLVLNVLLNYSV
jgi:Iap family predicted aminopeptidase